MAEADAPGNSRSQTRRRFYCHRCTAEITPRTQEYTCPRCNTGFVEEINGSGGSSSSRRSSREAPTSGPGLAAATELREMIHTMLTSAFAPMEVHLPRPPAPGATRSSRRRLPRRPTQRQETEGATNPIATVRILRTPRGHPYMGGVLGQFVHRLNQPTVMGPVNVMHVQGNPGDYVWGAGAMDAVVTQLLNQLDNYGPPPAEGEKIEALPTVTISQEQVDRTLQCSVCMDDFIFGESVRQLPCDHHYHSPCIVPWLKLHGTCPVCRKDLNGQDTSTADEGPFAADQNPLGSHSPTLDDPRT